MTGELDPHGLAIKIVLSEGELHQLVRICERAAILVSEIDWILCQDLKRLAEHCVRALARVQGGASVREGQK